MQSVVYTCRNTRAATSWPTITELTPTIMLLWFFTCYKRTVFIRHVYRWFNHFLYRILIKMTSMTTLLSVIDHFNEHSKNFFIICFGMSTKLRFCFSSMLCHFYMVSFKIKYFVLLIE